MDEKTVIFETTKEPGASGIRWEGASSGRNGKKRRTWIIALVIFLILLSLLFGYGLRKMTKSLGGSGSGESFSKDYLAVLDISGEIQDASSSVLGASGGYNHQWTMKEIDRLIKDKRNKGIFLRVDSPGGSVYTSDEIYYKILEYQEQTGRPVYSYMESMAASGGYYVSAPCDKIYANRNCWTGSIGVTMGTMYNITGLLDKLGIETKTITSGANKSMGSSTEELTEEQEEILRSMIDEAYDQFVGIVAEGRHMKESEVRKIADGRILTAKQAKEAGLIDDIMNEQDALSRMKEDEKMASGIDVEYLAPTAEPGWMSYLGGRILPDPLSELSGYQELLAMAGNGEYYTISYMAPIRK